MTLTLTADDAPLIRWSVEVVDGAPVVVRWEVSVGMLGARAVPAVGLGLLRRVLVQPPGDQAVREWLTTIGLSSRRGVALELAALRAREAVARAETVVDAARAQLAAVEALR